MIPHPLEDLHPYQADAIQQLLDAEEGLLLVAIMGAGKTAIALHALAELKATGHLTRPALVVAPLLIAETVWEREAQAWEFTRGLRISRLLGTPKKRLAALNKPADIYVINYDNLKWLKDIVLQREQHFSVLIADESSKIKTPGATRTKIMLEFAKRATWRWGLTGTPRGQQLYDVWAPSQFVTKSQAFPMWGRFMAENFIYTTQGPRVLWVPKIGAEENISLALRAWTHVVDRSALATRPPVVTIEHDVPLPLAAQQLYDALDGGITARVLAQGSNIMPKSELAIVGKLMQVCSGAVYKSPEDSDQVKQVLQKLDATEDVVPLHDRRLDMLQEIHEGHDRPTLVFFTFRHELARIQARFPCAQELTPQNIDAWNAGAIEMLCAHPASAGHGVNLQQGSDTAVWFSLPWSSELYEQANARLARQGQGNTVTIHILLCADLIDTAALRSIRQRIRAQEQMIEQIERRA
jgi:hypothetical protein